MAVGADLCTIEEAKDFHEGSAEKIPFMEPPVARHGLGRKSGPPVARWAFAWRFTPMVLTARLLKQEEPDCKIVFVGPCAAKKAGGKAVSRFEAMWTSFSPFEEVKGMFDAKDVDFASLPEEEPLTQASSNGRGFAVSGGVAAAVVKAVKRMDPDREVKVVSANGLRECKKMLMAAKAGKYNGYLLEGMACPGGCIAGAGTVQT